jgi:mono/diheme cytochrome c family protein
MRLLVLCAVLLALWPPTAQAGDAREGARLAEQWCFECHIIGPRDKHGVAGVPSFQAIARDAQQTSDYLRLFLMDPHPPMPTLTLSRQEVEDLLTYIQTQK